MYELIEHYPTTDVTNCYDWPRKIHQIARKTTSEIINKYIYMHVNDVVTDRSYAFAGFLVSTIFGVSPGQS